MNNSPVDLKNIDQSYSKYLREIKYVMFGCIVIVSSALLTHQDNSFYYFIETFFSLGFFLELILFFVGKKLQKECKQLIQQENAN